MKGYISWEHVLSCWIPAVYFCCRQVLFEQKGQGPPPTPQHEIRLNKRVCVACTNLRRMVHVVLAANSNKVNGFGMMLRVCMCAKAPSSSCSSLLLYIYLFHCVPGVTFCPDQLKGGWVWNGHRPESPIWRKGSVFTPLEGAACDTIYTHPLPVWPCCALCGNMHLCVCVL